MKPIYSQKNQKQKSFCANTANNSYSSFYCFLAFI